MTDRTKAILAIFGAQIIWGVAGPLVKIALGNIPPFSLLFLRLLFTCLLLFPIYEFRLRLDEPKKNDRDKKLIFLAGFFGVFVNIAAYFVGQKLTTVSDAWVITSIGTPMVILYSFFFRHEKLSKIIYLGITLAFAGTLVIIGTPLLSFGSGSVLGNLLLLLATAAGVTSFLITKELIKKFDPLLLTYYFFLTSVFFALPLFLWDFWQNPGWMTNIQPIGLITVAYLTLGSSIAAYTLQSLGLKTLPASTSSTIGYTSPVVAIGLSVIFLHEPITPFFLIGTSLVIVGLFFAEMRHPKHPIHHIFKMKLHGQSP